MNQPLIQPNPQQQIKFKQVNQLFKQIFKPQPFNSIKNRIQLIKNFGGVSSIMSLLQISHREGLSLNADHTKRIEVFSSNQSPKNQYLLTKYLTQQRDFTINILLYIISLRFFIKLLLLRDGIQMETILYEVISFVLLNIMIFLKAKVNLQFLKMDQNQKKYHDEDWIKVRRDGQIVQIKEKLLMVGDIILVQIQNTVRVDGIILYMQDLTVNQSQTYLKSNVKKKISIFNWRQHQNKQNFDPFIFSGTTILYGRAQILVCRVGEECSFRLFNQKFQKFSVDTTPLITNLRKVLDFVQNSSNLIAFCASSYFALYILNTAIKQNHLSWITFLQVLKTYSSFVGFVCLLQKLKIIRSLQFYLQSYKSDKYFKINNKSTLQKLNAVDLFIIDKDALKILQTQRGYDVPRISFIQFLTRHFQVKIISNESKQKVIQQFDLFNYNSQSLTMDQQSFFQYNSNIQNSEYRINRLRNCLFLTNCPRKKLQNQIIPIFQGMQYKIAYIYKFKLNQDNNKGQNIISICYSQQYSEAYSAYKQENKLEWIRIKNTTVAEDHIKQIIDKSVIFCQLYNVYLVQFLNNIVIFGFLIWVSIHRNYSIDFYWSLIIIIIARFIFFRLYQTIALNRSTPHQFEMISYRKIIYINLYLFFYYLYVVVNLKQKISVVLFFICNSFLRTDVLLYKIDRKQALKNIFKYNLIVFLIIVGNTLVNIFNGIQFQQQILLLKYVAGLSGLLILYTIFG